MREKTFRAILKRSKNRKLTKSLQKKSLEVKENNSMLKTNKQKTNI